MGIVIKKWFFAFILPLLILLLCGFSPAPAPPPVPQDTYQVQRVIDGDTILLTNGDRVRYIGIDTPETKHPQKPVQVFGQEAYLANKKLVEGKQVKLEFDIQKRDKYGRLLAYVYTGNIFVNAWLIKNGFAAAATFPPNLKHQDLFRRLEKEAKTNNLGLWGN